MFNKKLEKKISALEDYLSIAFVEGGEYGNYYLAQGYGKAKMLEDMYKEKEEGVNISKFKIKK
jgi:hypothetical protein